jgi:hypothetical protein
MKIYINLRPGFPIASWLSLQFERYLKEQKIAYTIPKRTFLSSLGYDIQDEECATMLLLRFPDYLSITTGYATEEVGKRAEYGHLAGEIVFK